MCYVNIRMYIYVIHTVSGSLFVARVSQCIVCLVCVLPHIYVCVKGRENACVLSYTLCQTEYVSRSVFVACVPQCIDRMCFIGDIGER